MRELLSTNYQWIFSGIGVSVISGITYAIRRKKTNKDDVSIKTGNNSITINNNVGSEVKKVEDSPTTLKENPKETTHILFIDDEHTKFKMVSILKKAGWINTKSVKDITNIDDHKVRDSNVIFVDINGVGKSLFKDEGLGLASAIKKKYPSKFVVIYSGESTGDRFHKALREVDDCLQKNAEPYQFINLIESQL